MNLFTTLAGLALASLLALAPEDSAAARSASGDTTGGTGTSSPSPVCTGPTCMARITTFNEHPWIIVRIHSLANGRALHPGDCDRCLDCYGAVDVRLAPVAQGSTLTVWAWGRVPTQQEQQQHGSIRHVELEAGAGSTLEPLKQECGGIMSVGQGSDVLTLQLKTPQGNSITTVSLGCGC